MSTQDQAANHQVEQALNAQNEEEANAATTQAHDKRIVSAPFPLFLGMSPS